MRPDDSAAGSGGVRRVLFVDDEPLVIRSLRRALASRPLDFEMVLAEGGRAAVEKLAEEPVDVVVSDLQMSELSGLELLAHVQEHHPTVPRVIASGFPERELSGRLAPYAHFTIAKPFELSALVATVGSALQLRAFLGLPRVREYLLRGGQPESPPPVFTALTERLAAGRTSRNDVVAILEAHPAIAERTVRLLRVLSFEEDPARTLASAIGGTEFGTIRAVALLVELLDAAANRGANVEALRALEQRAAETAHLAARLVGASDARHTAFAAGLLLEVGRLHVLPRLVPAAPTALSEDATVAEVGGALLATFGMPWRTIEPVLSASLPVLLDEGPLEVRTAVRVARALVLDPDAELVHGAARSTSADSRLEAWRRAARTLVQVR